MNRAVSDSSARNGRILIDSAVQTNTSAQRTSHRRLLLDRPGVVHSAMRRDVRSQLMAREGQSVGEEVRVTNVKSPLGGRRSLHEGSKLPDSSRTLLVTS